MIHAKMLHKTIVQRQGLGSAWSGDADAMRTWMCSPYLYNRGILFASLYKLFIRELGVFVTIHVAENFIHSLFVDG